MTKKKKPGIVFLYPGIPISTLSKDRAWTIFHRDVAGEHEDTNEYCWCSPIAIPSDLLEEGYSYEEYRAIIATSIH